MNLPEIKSNVAIPPKANSIWLRVANKMKVGDCVALQTRNRAMALSLKIKAIGYYPVTRKMNTKVWVWKMKKGAKGN